MKKDKIYFTNLDSIRSICTLAVFILHGISPSFHYLNLRGPFWEALLGLIGSGDAGVWCFFILSGFLITYLLMTEYERQSNISLKKFYIRRILRIWPVYYAIILFSFGVYPLLKHISGMHQISGNVFYYITFLSNFEIIHTDPHIFEHSPLFQNITWSVSIEEQYYLFWPLIFTFLPPRSWLFIILSALSVSVSVAFRIIHHDDEIMLHFHTLSVLFELALGSLLAYMAKEYDAVMTFFETRSTGSHLLLFSVLIGLLLLQKDISQSEYGRVINRTLTDLSLVSIICAQAFTKAQSPLNLRNLSFAHQWGKYSYGIYMYQPIALTAVGVALQLAHIPRDNFINTFVPGIVAFVLTLLVSWLSYEYFEKWFLRLKGKFEIVKTQS